ncbi:hypothetical protein [Chryseobacterium sp. Tr-659]|uniref:hypothetical protein n=1 Tax=Chryseobacterium sp. Tr-659 TaxID=2608340 RepID=UPI001423EA3F|nr:hypothetical protein [Chryseobacterium sp. Tr-659]
MTIKALYIKPILIKTHDKKQLLRINTMEGILFAEKTKDVKHPFNTVLKETINGI